MCAVHILLRVNLPRLVELLYACACGCSHTVPQYGTLWHTVAHCGSWLCRKSGIPVSRSSTCMRWTSSINIITKWHQGAFQALPHADSNLLNVYRRRRGRYSKNIYLPTGFGRILIICVESVMANTKLHNVQLYWILCTNDTVKCRFRPPYTRYWLHIAK